jgi:uncharacterized protein involved in response to NO
MSHSYSWVSTIPVEALSRAPVVAPRMPLFALGFRPFFLAAGVAGIGLVGVWIADYAGAVRLQTTYGPVSWHGHEMVFGYTVAVVAGFLLTAVRNWTSMQTPRGGALAALLCLWLAGRLVPLAGGVLPAWLVAAVDIAFLPALAASLAVPLLGRRQWRNLPFVPILLVLAAANLLVHLDVLGVAPGRANTGLYLGVDLIVLLIAIIGGRVIPFFTERALPGARPRVWAPVEAIAIGSVVALALLGVLPPMPLLAAPVAAIAAAAHAARLWGWSDRGVLSVPLLWILHAGYAWLVVGFALEALSAAGLARPQIALHAYTAGAIGALTLGMMARVSLGHTGRILGAAPPMVAAFALVNVAALLRVFAAWALPDDWYVTAIVAAGLAWAAAFALFVAVYAPILVRPRADGLEG